MDIVDYMLQFQKTGEMSCLLTQENRISKERLNVIVIEILSWLKLEKKRSMWMLEGKHTHLKPLILNMQYPWCRDLCYLVENEKKFGDYFSIKLKEFNFCEHVTEKEREIARNKAYENYRPQKRT